MACRRRPARRGPAQQRARPGDRDDHFNIFSERGEVAAEAAITYVAVRDGQAESLPTRLGAGGSDPLPRQALVDRLHHAQAVFYSGGTSSALEKVLHPEVTWRVPATSPIAGTYTGRAEVLAASVGDRDDVGRQDVQGVVLAAGQLRVRTV